MGASALHLVPRAKREALRAPASQSGQTGATSLFWHYVVGMPWVWAVAAAVLLPALVLGLVALDVHAKNVWDE